MNKEKCSCGQYLHDGACYEFTAEQIIEIVDRIAKRIAFSRLSEAAEGYFKRIAKEEFGIPEKTK